MAGGRLLVLGLMLASVPAVLSQTACTDLDEGFHCIHDSNGHFLLTSSDHDVLFHGNPADRNTCLEAVAGLKAQLPQITMDCGTHPQQFGQVRSNAGSNMQLCNRDAAIVNNAIGGNDGGYAGLSCEAHGNQIFFRLRNCRRSIEYLNTAAGFPCVGVSPPTTQPPPSPTTLAPTTPRPTTAWPTAAPATSIPTAWPSSAPSFHPCTDGSHNCGRGTYCAVRPSSSHFCECSPGFVRLSQIECVQTRSPSAAPTTSAPTPAPTRAPTSSAPTRAPTSSAPTTAPTAAPTAHPTVYPTYAPASLAPTLAPGSSADSVNTDTGADGRSSGSSGAGNDGGSSSASMIVVVVVVAIVLIVGIILGAVFYAKKQYAHRPGGFDNPIYSGNAPSRGRQGADIAPNVTNGFGGSFADDDEESV